MPWLKLEYQQVKKAEQLRKKFKVNGIPTLVLLDGDSGDVICKDAVNKIAGEDTKGEDFPWEEEE